MHGISESYLTLATLLEHLEISYGLHFLMEYILRIPARVLAHMKSERFLFSMLFPCSSPAGRAEVHWVHNGTACPVVKYLAILLCGWANDSFSEPSSSPRGPGCLASSLRSSRLLLILINKGYYLAQGLQGRDSRIMLLQYQCVF